MNVFKSSVDCNEGEEEDESKNTGDESGRLDDDGVTHEPEDKIDFGRVWPDLTEMLDYLYIK